MFTIQDALDEVDAKLEQADTEPGIDVAALIIAIGQLKSVVEAMLVYNGLDTSLMVDADIARDYVDANSPDTCPTYGKQHRDKSAA